MKIINKFCAANAIKSVARTNFIVAEKRTEKGGGKGEGRGSYVPPALALELIHLKLVRCRRNNGNICV